MERRNLSQPHRHGREIIEIIGDGTYDTNGRVASLSNALKSVENFINENVMPLVSDTAILQLAADETAFRFGRMFDKTKQEFDPDTLTALGALMIQPGDLSSPDNSINPAGYTFLGQFITHDLSFDVSASDFPISLTESDEDLKSKRTPTLDLDSLYGLFLDKDGNEFFNRALYDKDDERRFRLDLTLKDIGKHPEARAALPNDLPRENKFALIGDPRNDENLAIAQTHVAFLRFHNAVVDHLKQKQLVADEKLFETARMIVVKYYQAIILHDFLPRLVDGNILKEVIGWAETDDPKLKWLRNGAGEDKDPFIPVEFSAAAFRFGHSQVQDAYDWNEIFQSSKEETGTFVNLFKFTGLGNLDMFPNLLGSWAVDWRRFFDFSKYDIQDVPLNLSRKIDPNLADTMRQLQELILHDPTHIPHQNLAIRNLMRGRALLLPTGQEVLEQLTKDGKLEGKPLLNENDIASDAHEKHKPILEDPLKGKTPLWYYILREAEVIGEGNRLGTIGSYIVAETIVKLIQKSRISVFDNEWNPDFSLIPGGNPADGFEMADLIKFADSEEQPLINPLG